MDRTRRTHAGGPRGRSRATRLACLLALAALPSIGCNDILGDFDRIIALEVTGMTALSVEEGDTARFDVRALDAAGNVVGSASIAWAIIDTGAVGFTIDPASGLITAVAPGSGRIQASVDELRSDPLTVTVTPSADTIGPSGPQRIVFASTDPQSPDLTALVEDLTTTPGQAAPLAGQRVVYDVISPSPGSPDAALFFLTQSDTVPPAEPHRFEALTGSDGRVAAVLRRVGATHPADSAIVHAIGLRAGEDTVGGSPVRFVVVF